jgi:ComF family protein
MHLAIKKGGRMQKLISHILSFFFPITCSGCGSYLASGDRDRICKSCREKMPLIEGFVCFKCGYPLPDGGRFCHLCGKKKKHFVFDAMRSVYHYEGGLRELVLKFKYGSRFFLAEEFAKDLADIFNEYDFFKNCDFIIPVPLNILRRLKRGYNQAELLAEELSKIVKKPMLKNVLFRSKITKAQFKLSKKEREKNIKGSFYVKESPLIKKKKVLLIDDIATTGTTVSECAYVLKKAGVKETFVLTLARD